MNKIQAKKLGEKAFEENPCGPIGMDAVCASYRAAEAAGLSPHRDEITFPAFRRGYQDAHMIHYMSKDPNRREYAT